MEAEQAERAGDYGKVAEIRYGHIKETQTEVDRLKAELEEKQSSERMLKEEVTSDDIADVVSRWTGIPVSKMIQSEREKLLEFRRWNYINELQGKKKPLKLSLMRFAVLVPA